MSNTVIQIKRSAVTSTPPNGSLSAGELAISYASNKLFSGNSAGTGVDEIGGKLYVDLTKFAAQQANLAFAAANSAGSSATVNTIYSLANTAYDTANLAFDQANSAFDIANPALITANLAYITGNAAFDQANTARTHANAAFVQANTARSHANAAFAKANTVGTDLAGANTFLQSYADTAEADAKAYANSTFLKLSGGTVTGNLSVVGDLNISGNTYYVNVQEYRVDDPLIYLAANNYSSDLVDIGFIGNYVQGGANLHTAFYREHEDGEYYLIVGYDAEPANNHIGAVGTANSTLAYLNANLKAQSITVNSLDVETHIGAAFTKANTVGTDLANANTFLQGYADTAESDAISTAASYTDSANTFLRGYADTAESDAISTAASYTDSANTFLRGYADTAESDAISTAATYTDGANTYLQATFSNAANLTSGTLNSARLSGSYTGITGVGTLVAGTWNGSTIGVPYGGTGGTTFTTNGILYGQGASALAVTSAGSEGQVLQAGASGVPAFGDLDGGTF